MKMGRSVALPFSASWSTPRARGPASFFLGTFLSPGVIWGRSSCAAPAAIKRLAQARAATNRRERYRIILKADCPECVSPGLAFLPLNSLRTDILMNVHDKAPAFTLQDENGKEFSLKDLRGKTVVLYFYPRADTPG